MSLAALTCDPKATFFGLCHEINAHDPTHIVGPILERLIGPIVIFFVIYLAGRLIRHIATRAVVRAKGDNQVRTLVHNVITVTTFVTAILSAFVAAGLSISVLLTFGGLTSLAIGLAFQDLLRNILSGIFILLERPFKLGDWITVSASVNPAYGVSGSVQSVTLRTTTVRMTDGELASIPNLTVFSNLVVNASALERRQQTFSVRVLETEAVRPMVEHIRTTLPTVRGVEKSPSPIILPEPHVDGGFLVKCSYWVNRKRFDLDAVATAVANALWVDITPTSLPKDEA